MKWLFAILVALNIMVFGVSLSSRLGQQDSAQQAELVHDQEHELKVPDSVAASSAPAWVKAGDQASAPEPKVDETYIPTELTAEQKAAKEKERLAREKKQREERQKREQEAKAKLAAEQQNGNEAGDFVPAPAAARCVRGASVNMPEDDYHRIKGMLGQWPHAASRTVGRREQAAKKTVKYIVSTPAQGDAGTQIQALAEKGFSAVAGGSSLMVGTFNSRDEAQAMLGRLQGAGFGGQIREQSSGGSESLSEARMQVVFGTLNDSDFAAIQKIVSRYGKLQRGNCK